MILLFFRGCTTRNELGNSLKKSIWPIGSRKWHGNFSDDVFWLLGQFFSSFQSVFDPYYFLLAQSMRMSPKGCSSTWLDAIFFIQMAVCLVLLEKSNVPRGMSSHLYHSYMSPDHLEKSTFPSLHPGQSYGGFIIFHRLY